MKSFFKSETPYDKSKEFLDRQQTIDYMLVLTKLLEPGMNSETDLQKLVNKKITKIVEDLK